MCAPLAARARTRIMRVRRPWPCQRESVGRASAVWNSVSGATVELRSTTRSRGKAPRQALLWIERAREGDEIEIGADLFDTATLGRDGRLLLVTAGAIDEATYVTDEGDTDE